MKILKLNIYNLNSLKGKHSIALHENPFKDVGLFAITGDTGAGKTTILDALTLALYGKTPRKHEKEVMTFGTKECYSEVEFETQEGLYRAKWSQRTKRTGTIDEKFEIAELPSGNVIGRRLKSFVLPKIVELTGLTYQQFLKSVLLAQGDFAAFLKAGKDKRSELLEKITGTEVYSRISRAAFERYRVEDNALKSLRSSLDHIKVLPEEEEIELSHQLEGLQSEEKTISANIKSIQSKIQLLNELKHLENEKVKLEASLELVKTQISDFQPKKEQLTLHYQAFPFAKDFQQIENLSKKIISIERDLKKISQKKEQLAQRLERLQIQKEQATANFEKLNNQKVEKEVLFEQVIELDVKIDEIQKPLRNGKKTLSKTKKDLSQTEHLLTQSKTKQLELTQRIQTIADWMTDNAIDKEIQEILPDIVRLENTLSITQKEEQQLNANIRKTTKTFQKAKTQLQKNQKESQEIQKELEELKEAFLNNLPQNSQGDFDADLEDMTENMQDLRQAIANINQFVQDVKQLQKIEDEQRENGIELEDAEEILGNHQTDIEQAKGDLKEAEALEADKERIFQQERLIKNYETDRAKLQQGEQCPLCLSTEHPCHEHDYQPNVSATKKAWQAAQKKRKQLDRKVVALSTNIQNTQQNIRQLRQKQQNITGALKEMEDRIRNNDRQLFNDYFLYTNKNIEIIEGKRRERQELLTNFEETFIRLKSIKKQQDTLTLKWSKQQSNEAKYNEQLKNSEAILDELKTSLDNTSQKIATTTTHLESALTPFSLSIKDDFSKLLKKRNANFSKAQNSLSTTQNDLNIILNSIENYQNSVEKLKTQCSEAQNTFDELSKHFNELSQQRKTLFGNKYPKKERTLFQNQLKNAQEDLDNIKNQVTENRNAILVNQQTEQSKTEQLQTLQEEHQELSISLEKAAQNIGLADTLELRNAILTKNVVRQLEQEEKQLNTQITQKEQSLKDTNNRLKKLKFQTKVEEPLEELAETLTLLTTQQKQNTETIGGIKEKLAFNENQKVLLQEHAETIEKQETQYHKWHELYRLIGSHDGKKFRVYAQSLTLRKLASLANRHLKQLNDRYFIAMHETEALQLDIIDKYQGDNRRSMTTLSGGESFLVSLALALGLSDLAGRNAQIQSLFIDEGFGTLDARNLDLVIQTLENLQASGKTIGVISHVEALKERIYTQIQVIKRGHGFSAIQIVPN